MARKNSMHKEFECANGITYRGRSVNWAKKLDRRIKAHINMCSKSNTGGKEYRQPGSIKK